MTARRSLGSRVTISFTVCVVAVGLLTAGTIVLLMTYVPESVTSGLPARPATTSGSETLPTPVGSTSLPTTSGLGRLLLFAAIAFLLVVVVGALLVRRVVRRALSPLSAISDAARRAATSDLSARVPVDTPADRRRDEVTELAGLFNYMLTQLQRAFEAQRRFAANASHELQTPLATTQALLDVGLSVHHDKKVRQLLTDLRSLNLRSVTSVRALLDLADTDGQAGRLDIVELDRLVFDAVENCAADAAAAEIKLSHELDPATVAGETRLVQLLLGNMIDNAVRHNLHGGFVQVRLAALDGGAELRVSNSGRPLSADAARMITEPFFRVEGRIATAGGRAGRGLGGAIMAAVANRHGWLLNITPNPNGGLTVRLQMPAAAGRWRIDTARVTAADTAQASRA